MFLNRGDMWMNETKELGYFGWLFSWILVYLALFCISGIWILGITVYLSLFVLNSYMIETTVIGTIIFMLWISYLHYKENFGFW